MTCGSLGAILFVTEAKYPQYRNFLEKNQNWKNRKVEFGRREITDMANMVGAGRASKRRSKLTRRDRPAARRPMVFNTFCEWLGGRYVILLRRSEPSLTGRLCHLACQDIFSLCWSNMKVSPSPALSRWSPALSYGVLRPDAQALARPIFSGL